MILPMPQGRRNRRRQTGRFTAARPQKTPGPRQGARSASKWRRGSGGHCKPRTCGPDSMRSRLNGQAVANILPNIGRPARIHSKLWLNGRQNQTVSRGGAGAIVGARRRHVTHPLISTGFSFCVIASPSSSTLSKYRPAGAWAPHTAPRRGSVAGRAGAGKPA